MEPLWIRREGISLSPSALEESERLSPSGMVTTMLSGVDDSALRDASRSSLSGWERVFNEMWSRPSSGELRLKNKHGTS